MVLPTTANTSNPQGFGFGARLDELLLRLAEAPGRELVVQDAEMEADRVNTAQTPEAYLSAFGDVFARSAFWGGEGLRFAHVPENLTNAFARFWASEGVAVSREADSIGSGVRLAAGLETVEEYSGESGTSRGSVVSANESSGKFYVALQDAKKYRVSTNPLAASPTFSDEDPFDGESPGADDINDTAFLGNNVYAALGSNGIHQGSAVGTWSHWNDLTAHRLWAVKQRVLAAVDVGVGAGSLYEVTTGGAAPSPLKTLDLGDDWNDAVDAGPVILAAATNGVIYSFALNDSDTLVEQAQTDLGNETPVALLHVHGLVFYTTERADDGGVVGSLWQAQVSNAGTLVDAQLLRSWSDTSGDADRVPRFLVHAGRGIVAPVVDSGDTSVSLWRYDLVDGAITRITESSLEDLYGITAVEARLFTYQLNGSTGSLIRQSDTYQDSGHLIGPAGDLFTADDKSWVTAKLDAADLNGNGEQVDFYLTTNLDALDNPDHADWQLVKSYTAPDDSELAISQFSRYLAGMVKLTPSTDNANTPRVRSFAFRSYPGPGDLLIELPVNVSDQISSAGRRPRRVPGRGKEVFNELLSRSGREATLELYRHGITVTGLVERVSVPTPELGEAGSPTAHAMLRFRGRKATLTQV